MADSTPLKGSVPDRMQRAQQAIKIVSEIYDEIGPGEMGNEEKNEIGLLMHFTGITSESPNRIRSR